MWLTGKDTTCPGVSLFWADSSDRARGAPDDLLGTVLALPLGGTLSPKNGPGVSTGGRPQRQTPWKPRMNTSSGSLEKALPPDAPFSCLLRCPLLTGGTDT